VSEARIVSEWLAAGLAAEAAEDAETAARLFAAPDPFVADFGTVDPHGRVISGLVRGLNDETLADELDIDLADLEAYKTEALEREVAAHPGLAEAYALIEAGLSEVSRRAYIGLGEAMPGERSDLLNVLVGVYRTRLEALHHHPSIERKA